MSPDDFPGLTSGTYLAWHALGLAPRGLDEALERWRTTLGRGRRVLDLWAERWFEVQCELGALIGAPPGSIALFPSATTAQAVLAAGPLAPPRDAVVVADSDFHSSRYLWEAVAGEVRRLRCREDGSLDPGELDGAIDERVAWVALAAVSSFTGARLDARRVVARAHAVGARAVLDAYQAVGIVPIDVSALGVDALVGGTSKWLCGAELGLAFLYVRPDLAHGLVPTLPGWLGHARPEAVAERFEPAAGAARLQQGSMAAAPLYACGPGLRLVREAGVETLRARSLELTGHLAAGARARGLLVRTPLADQDRGGHVCLALGPEVVPLLRARGFEVDHRAGFGIRVAPHPVQSEADCDALLDAVTDSTRIIAPPRGDHALDDGLAGPLAGPSPRLGELAGLRGLAR